MCRPLLIQSLLCPILVEVIGYIQISAQGNFNCKSVSFVLSKILIPSMQYSLPAVLKADQTGILKFPMSPLSCSLGAPLGSSLLSGAPGLQVGSASHHLPLDLHLRNKLEHCADSGSKTKKGRRSRTVFTELQLMGLEKRFEKQKYLSTPDRYIIVHGP